MPGSVKPVGIALFQFLNEFVIGQRKAPRVREVEDLLIEGHGFPACEAFVLILKAAGVQRVEQGCRCNRQLISVDGLDDTAYIGGAVEFQFFCS